MTPKEKAQEIFNKMYQVDDIMGNYPMCFDTAKKCALIAVDEMIIQNGELYLLGLAKDYYTEKNAYLFNVKSELRSL